MNKEYLNEEVLPLVLKPATYQGNEIGAVHKTISPTTIRFAFAFPDTYEVGMSHIGMKILYGLLNKADDIWCERVFAPWTDMEAQMREKNIPLFALESMDSIKDFDFIGFTLQYEMSYSNVLNMLDLAGIPLLSKDRDDSMPLVIAGGPCAVNPEPLADFVDLFVIGEGEEVILELMQLYRQCKDKKMTHKAFLKEAAGIEGIYVPSLYQVDYNEDGTLKSFYPIDDGVPLRVRKRFIADLDHAYYPEQLVVPYTETVHDRVACELFRGCGRGCRFCQAGMIYRPIREKSQETIESQIATMLHSSGYEEISLASLSSGDYSRIEALIHSLVETYEKERIGVSLPSLRIDSVSIDMLEEIQKVRKSGITLAPEAGTQRMRDVINKGVTEEALINTVHTAFERGWGHIKLYFVIGLPTETDEDIEGIAALSQKVLDTYFSVPREQRNKSVKIVVSTSCFVPKPFTPFQWMGQYSRDVFIDKQKKLKASIKDRKITYNWHDSDVSYLEAVFARGDRRLGKVLLEAHNLGCRFDGWNEHFDEDKWQEAFERCGIDPDFYAVRNRNFDELLPWDFIDIGVTKEFLKKEWDKAMEAALTPYCKTTCSNCGIMQFKKGWKCHDHYTV